MPSNATQGIMPSASLPGSARMAPIIGCRRMPMLSSLFSNKKGCRKTAFFILVLSFLSEGQCRHILLQQAFQKRNFFLAIRFAVFAEDIMEPQFGLLLVTG